MGDAADDMYDLAMAQEETERYCKIHEIHYSSDNIMVEPICPYCEDGVEAVAEQPEEEESEAMKARKKIWERLVKWDGKS